ncbi:Cof-type HAD-IIB family hydrolase [Spirulina sp. CCNP1310]|uniref:Cof-type HAD-IIB family hydrolase n=1 Tax=Spirulina sp. CCNP1310 TaxID=3110249 RepID=UPI002B21A283|nr:Cof-type HAD-IIB family hydrolase [Spirulina sp. CCNP1310]MEA5417643.1 Cof-type HAD-IIB family hydrolase [Spirulina sp. CCNP1310]
MKEGEGMGIRLVVLDIDGTIAGVSNQVRPAVVEAIAAVQAQGVKVAIATGRMYCSALKFRSQINSREPMITYNGAWIGNPETGERLAHWAVPPERIAELLDLAAEPEWRSLLDVHVYHDDQLYVGEITAQTEEYVSRSTIRPQAVGDLHTMLDRPLTKLLMLCPDAARLDALKAQTQSRYQPSELYITQSSPTLFLEFTHPKASKGQALRYLAQEHYGIPLDQVLAIGDNYNDFDMLQTAGIGIAMGDAPPAVQAIATWVAPNVEADGVAVALERFILA